MTESLDATDYILDKKIEQSKKNKILFSNYE